LKDLQFVKDVQWAVENGFFNGKDMDKPMTREQAAAVTTRIIKYLKK
jgi:hypothetical protein